MTSLILIVYLFEISGRFAVLAQILFIVLATGTAVTASLLLLAPDLIDETEQQRVKTILNHKAFKCLWVVAILGLFMPSKQTMYTVLGLYIGSEVVSEASKSPLYDKAYKVLERSIDEYLKEEEK